MLRIGRALFYFVVSCVLCPQGNKRERLGVSAVVAQADLGWGVLWERIDTKNESQDRTVMVQYFWRKMQKKGTNGHGMVAVITGEDGAE